MKAHLKTHDPNRGNVKIEDPSEELLNVTDWIVIFNGLYVQSLVCCVYITGLYSIYKVLKYTLLTGHFFSLLSPSLDRDLISGLKKVTIKLTLSEKRLRKVEV